RRSDARRARAHISAARVDDQHAAARCGGAARGVAGDPQRRSHAAAGKPAGARIDRRGVGAADGRSRTRAPVGVRDLVDDGGRRSQRAARRRPLALGVGDGRRGAHRPADGGRAARLLQADASRPPAGRLRRLRRPAAASVSAGGGQTVLAAAADADRAAARSCRRPPPQSRRRERRLKPVESITMRTVLAALALLVAVSPASAQEARRRWELQRQIRLDKFEQVLPQAMRANGIDMWIVAVKENHIDPLWEDLGRGYVSGIGYYVFTDRGGERIERAALGPSGYLVEQAGAYDVFAAAATLPAFVKERNPKRIGVNMSEQIGPADGLSHTMYQHLVKTLGETYASRLVSAERVVSDFRSRRVATEIVAFGEAAGIAIQLTERALSNEVITPGRTTLEDVAWWLQDRLLERGLGSEFDMPSVYVTGPEGIVATSSPRIVQPGDVMMIDWGVQLMNFGTDVKRVAYVLKPGELAPPTSIQAAFDKALAVRDVVKKAIKPGVRADQTMKAMDAALRAAGYGVIEFNKPNADGKTDVVYGFHPVGNTGHDIGPSLTTWQPLQTTFTLHPQHLFSFEYFA